MDDITKQKLWEEIKRNTSDYKARILPHERTKEQLMELFGVGTHQIRKIIDSLLRDGIITRRKAISNGKLCTAYTILEETDEDTQYYSENES